MAAKKTDDEGSLKRLGGGRWQTRDERFTIEPQSGTWVIVDGEQTDDLGLPLVRGPFRSLTDAKAAVETARGTAAPESPLADRIKTTNARPTKTKDEPPDGKSDADKGAPTRPVKRQAPEPPPEARWISELTQRDRGRARRLIEQLDGAGVRDAEGIVRHDLTGGVPTVARLALADQLAAVLPSAADAKAVDQAIGRLVEEMDDGRDEVLGVRWRLVDGDGRPIGLTAEDLRAAAKRRANRKETKR
jgi:hypothetical protein